MEKTSSDIVSAARVILSDNGVLPMSFDDVAKAAGVSRALIYAQYGDQYGLLNAIIIDYLDALEIQSQAVFKNKASLESIKVFFTNYFDLIAQEGPALMFILRDAFMKNNLSSESYRKIRALLKFFTRAIKHDLGLDVKEAFSLFLIILPIVEEPARLAYAGLISKAEGKELSQRLLVKSLAGLQEDS